MATYAPYFLSTAVLLGWSSSIYVWSGVWQTTGYAAIIYIAALSGIDPALHEVETIDGA